MSVYQPPIFNLQSSIFKWTTSSNNTHSVIIIGGGPAGLMAAEVLSQAGVGVDLYDAMPTVGRKFLLAGRGGLNLTHSEPLEPFLARYGTAAHKSNPCSTAFGPDDLRAWAKNLGIETFVGSSGRVFPTDMKASPLLRAWLKRLQSTRRHLPPAPPLAGLARRRRLALHQPRRRANRFSRCGHSGAGRRQLG